MTSIALELALVAVIYVVISIVIQRRFSNIKRIKEIRTEMNAHQADLKKMDKNTNKEEIEAKQKQIIALTSEMMKHQLKASFIILPVSIVLIYLIIPYAFGNTQATVTVLSFSMSYRNFFIAAAIVLGFASQAIIAVYDKMAAKKAAESTQTTTNNI